MWVRRHFLYWIKQIRRLYEPQVFSTEGISGYLIICGFHIFNSTKIHYSLMLGLALLKNTTLHRIKSSLKLKESLGLLEEKQ